jgi:homogentisate 1,2-dioxygenase
MRNQAFCNNDGDFLILPQIGRLDIQTELGSLMVRPGELCVVQAGLRFAVKLPDGPARGYVHEIFGSHFELPDLGVIGSNGLAHPRDFEFPCAAFDLDDSKWEGTLALKPSRPFSTRC